MLLAQGATIRCGYAKCPYPGRLITDPNNIRREHVDQIAFSEDDTIANQQLWHLHPCAHEKTYGTKATTAGSDAHARAKTRRMTGQTKPKPKRKWPSRPMQSRPFKRKTD